ncbi:cytokine receptor common subunit beta [Puntigrus tetrazona]|uniref:cytokine receptor common subunit beta n=1 Tax=Puntigrus tetrazona TaxID=1606681 RepID=UPI001C8912B8|nr:cytokine receptor common subunit beta [Puntigrus tetrazona]XP_043091520.1 cytokine receptor common subunit beta [Puntigrus tetrazona]XP_043091521.1 cytokine receptor common subunit beta [Puntigrus tetrazona]
MFSTWIVHMAGFALLVRRGIGEKECPHHVVKPGKESAVLDSLKCHNDYMSYAQCTWEVDPQIHPQENKHKLYYRDESDDIVETPCISNASGVLLSNGKISHMCRYETTRFNLETSHILYFKVPCEPRVTTLRVAQHGKVRAPINLTERVADGGGRLLSWRSPYPVSSNITETLVYQLQYRGHMHDWTIVDNINASEYLIDKKSLLSGYRYEAKVRARGPVGLWSDWSPLVSWKTYSDGAFNLQCVIEGETAVTCTWQIKTEQYQFMSYHLWCNNGDKPSICCEDPQLKSRDTELSEFVCSVQTPDPYLLSVELKPVYYSRKFYISKHIKLSQPDRIHVKKGDGFFILSWPKPVFSELISDVQFCIELNMSTSETSKIFTFLEMEDSFNVSFTRLNSSAEYQAQIRLVASPDDDYIIESSQWSQPAVFKTEPVSSRISLVIYILPAVFVGVIFLITLYSGLPVLHRRIKIWKRSIPSPIKSKVLEGMMKKAPSGWPNLQNEKETTSICVLLAADNVSLCKSSVSWEPLLLNNEDAVKTARSGGSNNLHVYVRDGTCKDKSGMDFSGPYILCCGESCTHDKLPDGSTDRDRKCALGKSESSAPENDSCIATPLAVLPATQSTDPGDSLTESSPDEPPAYSPGPEQGCVVVPHPSGYFTMPCVGTG